MKGSCVQDSQEAYFRRLADYYMTETRTLLPGLIKASFPLLLFIIAIAFFANPYALAIGAFLIFFFLFLAT